MSSWEATPRRPQMWAGCAGRGAGWSEPPERLLGWVEADVDVLLIDPLLDLGV
jgi:hypothetical protein